MQRIPHSALAIGDEEIAAVTRVLHSGHLSQGREVEAFENECAEIVGRRHGVAVNSGTSALHLACEVLGLGPGKRVAMPSYGCVALLTAVTLAKAEAVLTDVGDDFNGVFADCTDVGAAIVPHLFGARASIPRTVPVIEDIAQSLGGATGREGTIAIASFYATKLMTTGEGGMILTDDLSLAEAVRDRRDYDNRDDFITRYNYKLTDLQAGIGRAQLRKLPGFIARRKEIAAQYDRALKPFPLTLPTGRDHVYFRYVVRTAQRDALEHHLNAMGIEAKRPVYRPAHHFLSGEFPQSERAHQEALSLPIFPAMTDQQTQRVVESIAAFFAS